MDPEGLDGSSPHHARCRSCDHRAAQRQEVGLALSTDGSAFRRPGSTKAFPARPDDDRAIRRPSLRLRYEVVPSNAALFAADIVEVAKSVSSTELDYSVDSLAAVDALIEGFRAQGISEERFAETLFGFGCYVGEVMIRHADGTWTSSIGTALEVYASFPLLVSLPPENLSNPIGKVFKRFRNGDADGIADFYSAMTTR